METTYFYIFYKERANSYHSHNVNVQERKWVLTQAVLRISVALALLLITTS